MILQFAALATLLLTFTPQAQAEEIQPYIESLKKKYGVTSKPMTDDVVAPSRSVPQEVVITPQEHVEADPNKVQPYIEKLREQSGLGTSPTTSNTESSNSHEVQPYIESLKSGHDLKPKVKTKVDKAAGISAVTSNRFNLGSENQANSFESVYRTKDRYSPGVDVFYEHQFFRNPYAGVLGLSAHLKFIMTKGKGIFTKVGGRSDDIEFRFVSVPVSVGPTYRFILGRLIAPFAHVGGLATPFLEMRNDQKDSRRSISYGYDAKAGIALSLDWISHSSSWDKYDSYGIVHTYLVIQKEYLRALSGPVKFRYDGLYAGLMFEF